MSMIIDKIDSLESFLLLLDQKEKENYLQQQENKGDDSCQS
tara:strand:- start:1174 stop:1296 length:123 start_codon:yes stop_codon:yes gene_type:complete